MKRVENMQGKAKFGNSQNCPEESAEHPPSRAKREGYKSGVPYGAFWIEVSNLGFLEIQMRNLKALQIQVQAGKIYICL